MTVVSFSDLPGAWASAARPSWYGWPTTEPADGKNGGFGDEIKNLVNRWLAPNRLGAWNLFTIFTPKHRL